MVNFLALHFIRSCLAILVLAQVHFQLASAQDLSRNATIDDIDSSVTYWGGWERVYTEMSIGGSHMVAYGEDARVYIKFRGPAYYIFSPKWASEVSMTISLDDGPTTEIDLRDLSGMDAPAAGVVTTPSNVVAFTTGIDSEIEHTLCISRTQGKALAFDAIIYTNFSDATESPTGPSLETVFGAVISVVLVLMCCLILTFLHLRRRIPRKQDAPPNYEDIEKGGVFAPSMRPLAQPLSVYVSVSREQLPSDFVVASARSSTSSSTSTSSSSLCHNILPERPPAYAFHPTPRNATLLAPPAQAAPRYSAHGFAQPSTSPRWSLIKPTKKVPRDPLVLAYDRQRRGSEGLVSVLL